MHSSSKLCLYMVHRRSRDSPSSLPNRSITMPRTHISAFSAQALYVPHSHPQRPQCASNLQSLIYVTISYPAYPLLHQAFAYQGLLEILISAIDLPPAYGGVFSPIRYRVSVFLFLSFLGQAGGRWIAINLYGLVGCTGLEWDDSALRRVMGLSRPCGLFCSAPFTVLAEFKSEGFFCIMIISSLSRGVITRGRGRGKGLF